MKTNSKLVRLGTICTVVSGTTPDTNNASYWNGDLPWITPAEIEETSYVVCQTARCITKQAVNKKSLNLLPKGTVLLSSRAPIGKVAIAGIDMYCNQGFKNLICSPKIYNEYLYFFLKAKTEYLKSLGRGATFKEISKSIVENILIPLPDIKTQKRIAERLDKVQKLIALQKEQLKKLDNLIKSRFIDLFGDPITNSENWELQQLVDIADVTSSKRIFEKEYVDSGIPFFRTKEIVELEQGLAPSTKIFITKARYDEIKAQFGIPQAGDLLISAVGTIGHIWIVPKDFSFYFKDGNLLWIKKPQYNSIFLRYLLPILVKHEISHVASGTAYQALTINKLGQTLVPLCPIKLQTQFADFVTKIEAQKGLLTTRLSHLETLYKSLMQEYFG